MELTRQSLASGAWLDGFSDLPGQPRWSRPQILADMDSALQRRPEGQPVWLFSYGSLIWNPLFHYAERQPARLAGWQRRFCLCLLAGRASPGQPGRMLALDAGGQCRGMAFRLQDEGLHEELALVWLREMPYGMYRTIWQTVELSGGQRCQALVFVANPQMPGYASDSSVKTTAPQIASACGPLGSNLDYLLQLQQAMQRHDIRDPYVEQLAAAARQEASLATDGAS